MTGPVRRAPLATGPCHGTGARRPPDPAWAGSRHHRTGPHPDSEPRPVTGPHRAKPPPRAAGPRQVTGPTPRAGPRRMTPPLVTGQHQASGRRPASGCHRAAGPSDPRAASAADPVHRPGPADRWPGPDAAHRPDRLSVDLRQAAPAHRRPADRHGRAGRPARPRRRRVPGRPASCRPPWRRRGPASGSAVVVVNATEGEPGSYKDKTLLRKSPYLVLGGALVVAWALRAKEIVIGVSGDGTMARWVTALANAEPDLRKMVIVVQVPERFVSGESSALVNAINGKIALPSGRQVRASESGVDNRPDAAVQRRDVRADRRAGHARPGELRLHRHPGRARHRAAVGQRLGVPARRGRGARRAAAGRGPRPVRRHARGRRAGRRLPRHVAADRGGLRRAGQPGRAWPPPAARSAPGSSCRSARAPAPWARWPGWPATWPASRRASAARASSGLPSIARSLAAVADGSGGLDALDTARRAAAVGPRPGRVLAPRRRVPVRAVRARRAHRGPHRAPVPRHLRPARPRRAADAGRSTPSTGCPSTGPAAAATACARTWCPSWCSSTGRATRCRWTCPCRRGWSARPGRRSTCARPWRCGWPPPRETPRQLAVHGQGPPRAGRRDPHRPRVTESWIADLGGGSDRRLIG